MIYIVIFWNYIHILEVLKIQALILEPHKQNLCETNSIQKTTKFIINIMSRKSWKEKIINTFYPSNEYEQQQLMIPRIWNKNKKQERSYNNNCLQQCHMKKIQILCKEVLLYTKPGKQNFCWVGTQNFFLNFNINRKPYFLSKTNKNAILLLMNFCRIKI